MKCLQDETIERKGRKEPPCDRCAAANVVCYDKTRGPGCFQCWKQKLGCSTAGGNKKRKRVVVEMPQRRVGQEPDEEWMRAPPLTQIMDALEEWVQGQKEMIREMECIWVGYDAQREEDRKWREEEREWREEQRKWRKEDREEGKKKIDKKEVGVQVEEEEDGSSSPESDDELEEEEKED